MNSNINKIHARYVLDSRANPTVEVEITLEDGFGEELQYHPVRLQEHWKLMN